MFAGLRVLYLNLKSIFFFQLTNFLWYAQAQKKNRPLQNQIDILSHLVTQTNL